MVGSREGNRERFAWAATKFTKAAQIAPEKSKRFAYYQSSLIT